MFKKLIPLLVCLLLSFTSFAGNEHGGIGVAEKNIVFAYMHLPRYLEFCLKSQVCRLNPEEQKLLQEIFKSLPQEGPAEKILVFKSESEAPGFFMIEGQVRLAKTQYFVGSTIYINRDLLYGFDRARLTKPLSLSAAVGLLVHELGHHQGEKDHTKLDVLGSKVQSLLSGYTQQIDGGRHLRNIVVTAIDFGISRSATQILISDSDALYDLTPLIIKNLSCAAAPIATPIPSPIAEDRNITLTGFNFWNLHWSHIYYIFRHFGEKSNEIVGSPSVQEMVLSGSMELECQNVEKNPFNFIKSSYSIKFEVKENKEKNSLIIPESIVVDATPTV